MKQYIPRRAVLYVPGSDDRKLQKIPKLGADCIVMDCEDGVALSKKVTVLTSSPATLVLRQRVEFLQYMLVSETDQESFLICITLAKAYLTFLIMCGCNDSDNDLYLESTDPLHDVIELKILNK